MPLYRYLLIIVDVVADTLSDFFEGHLIAQLYIYLLQDLTLLVSLMILTLQFFRDDILRAHLVSSVLARHWTLLAVSVLYLLLTVSMQVVQAAVVDSGWKSRLPGLLLVLMLRRLFAILYYFSLSKPVNTGKYLTGKKSDHLDRVSS